MCRLPVDHGHDPRAARQRQLLTSTVCTPRQLLADPHLLFYVYPPSPPPPQVRRDNCLLVRNVVTTCLEKILIQRDMAGAVAYVKTTISDLLLNKVDLSLLVISKVSLFSLTYCSLPLARMQFAHAAVYERCPLLLNKADLSLLVISKARPCAARPCPLRVLRSTCSDVLHRRRPHLHVDIQRLTVGHYRVITVTFAVLMVTEARAARCWHLQALTQDAEDYKTKAAHVELAEKMRKRDAATVRNAWMSRV